MRVLGVTLALGILFFSTAGRTVEPALAAGTPLVICNQTAGTLSDVAVGYHSTGVNDAPGSRILTGPFVSTGWVRILHGQCATFANPFNARYMFWWGAVAGGINAPGTVWNASGDQSFCIPNVYGATADMSSSFTFEDENVSQSACESGRANPRVGPNIWARVRKVDLEVNAQVNFDGN